MKQNVSPFCTCEVRKKSRTSFLGEEPSTFVDDTASWFDDNLLLPTNII